MTQSVENKADDKKAKAEAVKARSAEMERREKELNAGKSGIGLRTMLAMTRGKNPQEIQYEAFDESLPDTLPKTLSEFMDLTKADEPKIVGYLIDGFNSTAYTEASDPIAEYVEASWPTEIQRGFKLAVKNYAFNTGVSIEDTVALMKPAFVKAQSKS